jgi:MoaA/NifB/PqqE/SkfB family radical SAM enzyme
MKPDLENSKLRYHPERIAEWQQTGKVNPITVDLALTRRCNYDCTYCYSMLQENPGKDWTREMIIRTWHDFHELGVKGISLVSDGESPLNKHCNFSITYAKSLNLDIAIGTNGYFFTPTLKVLEALTYLRFNFSAAYQARYCEVHGVIKEAYDRVLQVVRDSVALKRQHKLPVTIGLQMVFLPEYEDQVLPLVLLSRGLGVDYLQIKHCSDDEEGSLGIDHYKIKSCRSTLKAAEALSNNTFHVIVKWKKIMAGSKRKYKRCLAPPFHLQISGSGLVAPCGMFFNQKYERFHLGNLHEQRFRDIVKSKKYWEVMNYLASDEFNAQTMCGCLCLQDASNYYLDQGSFGPAEQDTTVPHRNFI